MRGLLLAVAVLAATRASAAPSVTAEPELVVLGTGTTVEVDVSAEQGSVHGYAAIGKLERDVDEPGRYRWTPPDIRYPTTALLLFWSQAQSPGDIAVVRIRLVGRTELKISTEPKATVHVQVQERLFGPVQADSRGRASVPIEVPPDVRRAKVLVEAGGRKSTREAVIDVPDTNPLAATFATESFAADERGMLIVAHAHAISPSLSVSVTGASTAQVDASRDVALYAVSAQPGRSEVEATVGAGEWKVLSSSPVRAAGLKLEVPTQPAQLIPFVGLGGYWGGGANLGPAVFAGVGRSVQVGGRAVILEAELGVRTQGLVADVPGLGRAESRLAAVPLVVAARYRVLRVEAFAIDLRGGLGVLFFSHTLTTAFQPTVIERGVRPDGFVAVAGGLKLNGFEPFAELRAQWGAIRTPAVDARIGGVGVSLGVRYAWR